MPSIAVLSDELASQIAAGEVIERPASALKELLENSMDAGATRCSIKIEGGGITRLSVLDDGSGMSEEDARLCIQRHATSKLRALADLDRLSSYGFRGEALPSIASVSRLSIRTRRAEEPSGIELRVEGGLVPEVRPVGCPPGTLVEVRDLFFNVPARRKFMRSTGTESGHLAEVVESLALANPRLALTLERDGRVVREWLRATDRRERALGLFEEEIAECRGERGPLGVEAFLTRPERARTGAGGLRILVNGRPVRDRALAVAVAQAYGSVLERGRYPRGVVYLELPPELVDFNVHPQKLELRFADPRAVSDALYQVLAAQLARGFSLPTPSGRRGGRAAPETSGTQSGVAERFTSAPPSAREEDVPAARASAEAGLVARDALGGAPRAGWSPAPARSWEPRASAPFTTRTAPEHDPPTSGEADSRPPASTQQLRPSPSSAEHVEWAALTFVAQLRQTFLICEGPAGLYVLDQHAAAERVTFDRLRREYRSKAVASQALLFPVEIQLDGEEAEFLDEHAERFAELGMDLRRRADQWLSIHAIPKLLQRLSPERLLRDLLAETMRQGGRGFSAAVDLALATLACHASVRAGDALSAAEAKALLEALDGVDFAGHCPHGRPIVSFSSWSELERKVGRH